MKNQFSIFYSWQSDLDNKHIRACLKDAVKKLQQKHGREIKLDIKIDTATDNRSGSIDIANSIFEKISICDIFIADVTLINNNWVNRLLNIRSTPNPNTIIELGFAVKSIGWERIICVSNTKYGNLELLPFDIRKQRVSNYNSNESLYKDKLTEIFIIAIKSIIDNYNDLQKRHQETGYKTHDKDIYTQINELCNQQILNESLTVAVNSLFTNRYYYKKWSALINFYSLSVNHFLDTETDLCYKKFLDSLDAFETMCSLRFFPDMAMSKPSRMDLEERGITITPEMEIELLKDDIYRANKEPYHNESYENAAERTHRLQNELSDLAKEVRKTYHQFVIAAKKNILV